MGFIKRTFQQIINIYFLPQILFKNYMFKLPKTRKEILFYILFLLIGKIIYRAIDLIVNYLK